MTADIGIVNAGGGLRAELLHAGDTSKNPANTDGVVTYAEANAVLPFVNNVSLVKLKGADLKEALEQQWQPPTNSRPVLNLGLSDNVRVTTDASRPRGERITSVIVDGEPLDLERVYTVSTISFLASGGDNFSAFAKGESSDTGLVDRDLWINYLKTHKPISPDFARQQVNAPGMPAQVVAGDPVSFEFTGLDLNSLGSPTNDEVEVFLTGANGSTSVGTFPVSEGTAAVSFTAPSELVGSYTISARVAPSGTEVGPPVAEGPPAPVALSATAEPVTYGKSGTVEVRVTPKIGRATV